MLVGIGLVAVYFAYSRLTAPWLIVERKESVTQSQSHPQEKLPVFTEKALQWFQADPWVKDANAKFRDGGRLLYFDKWELENNDHTISISPVAFLWQQEGDEVPITATAQSAQLDSSTPLKMQEAKLGKIVSGSLYGDVLINGPDGLRIEGRSFHISEDAMKIWTGQPVKFAWGTHSGRAESGAEIELLGSDNKEKDGLLAINDVQRIRLRGRIHCDLSFQDQDSLREPIRMNVSAANGFEFFVPTKEATFSGFLDRTANRDNQVLIEHPTATGTIDQLYCSKLVLKFQPVVKDADPEKKSTQLQLSRIEAEGQPVEFTTTKDGDEQVYARMGMLKYHLENRMIELLDNDKRFPVEVHQAGSKLTASHVLVAMSEDNEVHTIECRGEGRIGPSVRIAGLSQPKITGASWATSLLMRRAEEQRITITGNAKVIQATRLPSGKLQADLSLSSDVMDLFLDNALPAEVDSSPVAPEGFATPMQGLNISKVRPRQLVATGNVSLTAQDVSGNAREKLVVSFEKDATAGITDLQDSLRLNPDASVVKAVSQTSESPSTTLSGKTTFFSDTIEAVVRLPDSGQPQFEDVWLKGDVKVSHVSANQDKSTGQGDQDFTANGNMLFAKSGFTGKTEISLFGDPAAVVNASNRIEGQRIDLSEMKATAQDAQRQARVEGSGRIRFVVNTGLDGKPLAKPSPLDIYWGDHMSFSGRTAHFVGNIRAVMNNKTDHDVELTCAGLKVHFSDEVKLESAGKKDEFRISDSKNSRSPAGDIERIECESRVVLKIDMMEKGVVLGRHYAEFADLEFNQITGEFRATGPGLIESTQPDKGKRRLASSSRTVVRSNTPSKTSEETFFFIRANFIGELNGNSTREFVRLKQHIRGIFGPVRSLTDRLEIDGLSAEELPENTGALHCENLSISAIPGASKDLSTSFSLVAESNAAENGKGTRSPCRFESKMFAGVADKIKYDHSKQQFILLADEGRQATVSNQRDGGSRQVLNGGRFEYYTDRNHLVAEQITGVQSTGDLSTQ